MGAPQDVVVSLSEAGSEPERVVGGKARMLGRLIEAGHRVPDGFCISVGAYERYFASADLAPRIQLELGRKAFSDMRWEEIWDAALRIRSAFLGAPIPPEVADPILEAYKGLSAPTCVARSSAPGEDSSTVSHAGLHESQLGITDEASLLDACRMVWASLWSDAALLYRHELGLDVSTSGMAIVVQGFVSADVSGVAFGIDPRQPREDRSIVEAVPGPCEDLVSGRLDPDRWIITRSSGQVLEWRPGERGGPKADPILEDADLLVLHRTMRSVESLLDCPPDIEWTGLGRAFTLLQARPVTTRAPSEDERDWYLSLRPGAARLHDLFERVTKVLIPALETQAADFAADELRSLDDAELADAISSRKQSLDEWRTIYKDEFIPFAHGVRRLGLVYNDAVRPKDPFEFVGLLERQPMMATRRNEALSRLAETVASDPGLKADLEELTSSEGLGSRTGWHGASQLLRRSTAGDQFCQAFEELLDHHMNTVFDGESLSERADLALSILLQLASGADPKETRLSERAVALEEKLLAAVGPERRQDALEALRIGRVSWRLRDDDNILMGRLEHELRRAMSAAVERLVAADRLELGKGLSESAAEPLIRALREGGDDEISLPAADGRSDSPRPQAPGASPRQIVGQPAGPGLATGTACVVLGAADLAKFQRGDVLVCDAIQPTMTQLVPLASAVVERRGGMLIHGAIIARELGIPCVNGVPEATSFLKDGDLLTVDGYLGLVTVGPPEFELESRD